MSESLCVDSPTVVQPGSAKSVKQNEMDIIIQDIGMDEEQAKYNKKDEEEGGCNKKGDKEDDIEKDERTTIEELDKAGSLDLQVISDQGYSVTQRKNAVIGKYNAMLMLGGLDREKTHRRKISGWGSTIHIRFTNPVSYYMRAIAYLARWKANRSNIIHSSVEPRSTDGIGNTCEQGVF